MLLHMLHQSHKKLETNNIRKTSYNCVQNGQFLYITNNAVSYQ